jgi:hypothetical protein
MTTYHGMLTETSGNVVTITLTGRRAEARSPNRPLGNSSARYKSSAPIPRRASGSERFLKVMRS